MYHHHHHQVGQNQFSINTFHSVQHCNASVLPHCNPRSSFIQTIPRRFWQVCPCLYCHVAIPSKLPLLCIIECTCIRNIHIKLSSYVLIHFNTVSFCCTCIRIVPSLLLSNFSHCFIQNQIRSSLQSHSFDATSCLLVLSSVLSSVLHS